MPQQSVLVTEMTTGPQGSIFLEDARIIEHQALDGDQYILKLQAPLCAEHAGAGQFVHLQVSPHRPLRRPISIMRADPENGWIELLYKRLGQGTELLSQRQIDEQISCLGPIGNQFHVETRRPLLMGGGVGMPPMIYLANQLRKTEVTPLVILGSEVPFPFKPRPSELVIPGIPDGVIGAMPLLEDWNVASRLTSTQGYPGCHDGYVTDLARHWLDALDEEARNEVSVFACGPLPMLEEVTRLAIEYRLPVQISVEEFMACGVGGCAGCTIEVQTGQGLAMKRVCVDGPVFDGRAVFR